jgi:hypothetical protein
MTSNEFIFWLRGFTKGLGTNNPTPSDWEFIKHTLNKVDTGEWKPEHGTNSPTFTNDFNPPYTTGGDDDFVPNKELLLSNK